MRWGKGFSKSDAQSRTPLKSAIESPSPQIPTTNRRQMSTLEPDMRPNAVIFYKFRIFNIL